MADYQWDYEDTNTGWEELSAPDQIAPLGERPPGDLARVFPNSMFK